MANSSTLAAPTLLQLTRLPGEHGPVVRCSGNLVLATTELLRRELDLLTSLRHRALVLNLSECRSLDVEGVIAMLETYRRMREHGQRLVLVAGTDPARRLLDVLGVGWIVPVFPSEAVAAAALRGCASLDVPPVTWQEARKATLTTWRALLAALTGAPVEDLMGRITLEHGLCRRSSEVMQAQGERGGIRCQLCPLFQALGGRTEDVGCQSLTQPMLQALSAGDREEARAQIQRLIHLVETMELPEEGTA